MDLNKFRLGLAYMFVESTKLGARTKTQLINFIENADVHQLKVLAMDGDIVSKSKLDEAARDIIDDRFDNSILKKINKAALEGIAVATDLKKLSEGPFAIDNRIKRTEKMLQNRKDDLKNAEYKFKRGCSNKIKPAEIFKCKAAAKAQAVRLRNQIKKYEKHLQKLKAKSTNEGFVKNVAGTLKDVGGAMKKEKEIKKLPPEKRKKAWANHLAMLCRKDAKRWNWPPEKLKKCVANSMKYAK